MDSSEPSWSSRLVVAACILVSFFIVALGQPAWVPWLGLVASVCGYAIFWKGMLYFKRQRDRFWLSTIWFTGVQLIQLSWLTSDEYHGLYIWGVWLVFAAALGLQFGVLSFFVRPAIRLTIVRTLAVPAAWTTMEWLRLYFTSGFTWNPVGLAITGYSVPAQMASLIGIYGLSFWVMMVNVLVLQLLLKRRDRRRWVLAASMAAIPYLFGTAHLMVHDHRMAQATDDPLSIILVQTGYYPKHKEPLAIAPYDAIHPLQQWHHIVTLLSKHEGKPVDLIVMPESTVPFRAAQLAYSFDAVHRTLRKVFGDVASLPLPEGQLGNEIETYDRGPLMAVSNRYFGAAIANHFNANVVVGMEDYDSSKDESYGAAVNFQPGRSDTEEHHKRVLIPIAESIPYTWLAEAARQYGMEYGLTPGDAPTIFSGKVPVGVTICYEETFSGLARETRQEGAELFINLTADGWYPNTRLPMQHFTHGRVRAIENGVPLVRSAHTGVTVAVDSLGRTIANVGDANAKPENKAEALYVQVPRYHHHTLYSKIGDGFIVSISLLTLLLLFRSTRKK